MSIVTIEQLFDLQDKELGVSDWLTIDQTMINAFADVTRDWQFIHIDTEKAKQTPFGGTIAHGFLTLSLLSAMAAEVLPSVEGQTSSVNYGMNNLRFLSPVPNGHRVRGRFSLKQIIEKRAVSYQLTLGVTVEIENHPKPALVAEWLTLMNF
ncbi:MaoC family dehydratase [Acinetobacter nosocomialis]|uniref:MaoC family dehydratase n=1 Tax=Acinetobacter nosocomialis TaxID=106654 RepID=UPI00321569FE